MYKYFFNWFFKFYALILTISVFSESGVNAAKLTISTAIGTLIAVGVAYGIKKMSNSNKRENTN
jgi:uncharacterized membrane protein YgaE (UPF0421/DUF939 family)